MRFKMKYFLCVCMGKLYKISRFIYFFFTLSVVIILFAAKALFPSMVSGDFSFWFFLVSKSYGQNTKQDTLLCARVRCQMKN